MWPFKSKQTQALTEVNSVFGQQVLGSQIIIAKSGKGAYQFSYVSTSNTTAARQQIDITTLFSNGAFSASNNLITKVIAQMKPQVMYMNEDTGEYEDALKSEKISRLDKQKAKQVSNLLRRPNQFQTTYEFLAQLIMWINATGECFILNWRQNQDDVNETPKEMFILDSTLCTTRANTDHFPSYRYSGASPSLFANQDEFKWHQISHIMEQPFQGSSGFNKLIFTAELVNLSQQIHQYSNYVLANAAKPSGFFKTEKPIDDKRFKIIAERLKEQWNNLLSRDADLSKPGQAMLLEDGFTYQPLEPAKLAGEDMHKLKEAVDKQICGILGVPPGLVGIGAAEKYNNSVTARDEFYRSTIYPLTELISQKLNSSFFKAYPNLCIQFNPAQFIKGDALAQAQFAGSLVTNGILTQNEAREYLGYKKLPGMDVLMPASGHAEPDGDEPDVKPSGQDTGGSGGSPPSMIQAPKIRAVK